jgi:hypothetical protein
MAVAEEATRASAPARWDRLACSVALLHAAATLATCSLDRSPDISTRLAALLCALLRLRLCGTGRLHGGRRTLKLLGLPALSLGALWPRGHLLPLDDAVPSPTDGQRALWALHHSGIVQMLLFHATTAAAAIPFSHFAALQAGVFSLLAARSAPAVASALMSTAPGAAFTGAASLLLEKVVAAAELLSFPFSSLVAHTGQHRAAQGLGPVLFLQAFMGLLAPLYYHLLCQCKADALGRAGGLRAGAGAGVDAAVPSALAVVLSATLLGMHDASYHATALCHTVILSSLCSGTWIAAHAAAPLLL